MSDDRNIREEALGVVTRNDAPGGQGWSCPNCDHWASIGGNATYHARSKNHDVPVLKMIPAHVPTLSNPYPNVFRVPVQGDIVIYHFTCVGGGGKLEHRTRPAIVTSVWDEEPGDIRLNLHVFFENCDSGRDREPLVEKIRMLDRNDNFITQRLHRWSLKEQP